MKRYPHRRTDIQTIPEETLDVVKQRLVREPSPIKKSTSPSTANSSTKSRDNSQDKYIDVTSSSSCIDISESGEEIKDIGSRSPLPTLHLSTGTPEEKDIHINETEDLIEVSTN